MNAIYRVAYRAESQTSIEDIKGTYVDTGVFKRINNVNDQIIFGRRGTGKTHLLKHAAPKLEASKNNGMCVYIDIRKLSSASEMSCGDLSIEKRSYAIIKDISNELHSELQVQSNRFSSYKNITAVPLRNE